MGWRWKDKWDRPWAKVKMWTRQTMQLQTACSVLNAAWSARLRASRCSRCYSQCAQCQWECACSRAQCSVAFCHIYLFVNFWFRMYCIYMPSWFLKKLTCLHLIWTVPHGGVEAIKNLSTIDEAFADCALSTPPGRTPLWGFGFISDNWADVCGSLKPWCILLPTENTRLETEWSKLPSWNMASSGLRRLEQHLVKARVLWAAHLPERTTCKILVQEFKKSYQRSHEGPLVSVLNVCPFTHGILSLHIATIRCLGRRFLHHWVTWWRACPSTNDASPVHFFFQWRASLSFFISHHTTCCTVRKFLMSKKWSTRSVRGVLQILRLTFRLRMKPDETWATYERRTWKKMGLSLLAGNWGKTKWWKWQINAQHKPNIRQQISRTRREWWQNCERESLHIDMFCTLIARCDKWERTTQLISRSHLWIEGMTGCRWTYGRCRYVLWSEKVHFEAKWHEVIFFGIKEKSEIAVADFQKRFLVMVCCSTASETSSEGTATQSWRKNREQNAGEVRVHRCIGCQHARWRITMRSAVAILSGSWLLTTISTIEYSAKQNWWNYTTWSTTCWVRSCTTTSEKKRSESRSELTNKLLRETVATNSSNWSSSSNSYPINSQTSIAPKGTERPKSTCKNVVTFVTRKATSDCWELEWTQCWDVTHEIDGADRPLASWKLFWNAEFGVLSHDNGWKTFVTKCEEIHNKPLQDELASCCWDLSCGNDSDWL